MVSSDIGSNFAQGVLFFANLLNTVTIDNVVVPDVVEMGNSSSAVLDCQFTAADDRFTLQWLFERGDEPVYEWRPGTAAKVSGILEGRVDPTFKISNATMDKGRALRIVQLDPELSGEYTCRVLSDDGGEARQAKSMLVFNPEVNFTFEVYHYYQHTNIWDLKCNASQLTLQPELTLEYNTVPIAKQSQSGWHEGNLYSVSSQVQLKVSHGVAACRLRLPAAGYTALRTRTLHLTSSYKNEKIVSDKSSNEEKKPNSAPAELKIFSVYSLIILSLAVNLKTLIFV